MVTNVTVHDDMMTEKNDKKHIVVVKCERTLIVFCKSDFKNQG